MNLQTATRKLQLLMERNADHSDTLYETLGPEDISALETLCETAMENLNSSPKPKGGEV